MKTDPPGPAPAAAPRHDQFLRRLGPGLITGAADDDPSGIATYSQVGAQYGFGLAWTMLFSLPFMIVIQEISGRIGYVTGHGIAENLRRHYSPALVRVIVLALLAANTINLGADIGAMGSAVKLLFGGSARLYTLGFGIICIVAEIFVSYVRYAALLKWMTLALFAYVAVVFAVHMDWGRAIEATLVPHTGLTHDAAMALVAVLGTTISPYLFFWQAALEEQNRAAGGSAIPSTEEAAPQLARIRTDTVVGMTVSNLVALSIIYATASTLHVHGVTVIASSSQAADALRPIAGAFTFALFAFGIVGTGLLAVPVLAGSSAYALSEAFAWRSGLDRTLMQAKSFYATIAVSTLLGVAMNFTRLDPVRALYWSAVLNGLLSAPIMAAVMLVASNDRIMGAFALPRAMRAAGWAATLLMLAASIGFFIL